MYVCSRYLFARRQEAWERYFSILISQHIVQSHQSLRFLLSQLLQRRECSWNPPAVHPNATLGRDVIKAETFDKLLLVEELAGTQQPQILVILPLMEEDPGARTLQGLSVSRPREKSAVGAADDSVDEFHQNVLGFLK